MTNEQVEQLAEDICSPANPLAHLMSHNEYQKWKKSVTIRLKKELEPLTLINELRARKGAATIINCESLGWS